MTRDERTTPHGDTRARARAERAAERVIWSALADAAAASWQAATDAAPGRPELAAQATADAWADVAATLRGGALSLDLADDPAGPWPEHPDTADGGSVTP